MSRKFEVDPGDRDGPIDPALTGTISDAQWRSLQRRQKPSGRDEDEQIRASMRMAAQFRNRRRS